METTQYDRAFFLSVGQLVIIIHEVEFKADATATTHDQIQTLAFRGEAFFLENMKRRV